MTTPAPTTTKPPEPAKTSDPAAEAADKAAAKVAAEKQAELEKNEAAKSASQDDKPSGGNLDKTTAGTNPNSDAAQNNAPLPDGPAKTTVTSNLPDGYVKLKQFYFIVEDAGTPDDHTLFGLNGIPFKVSDLRSIFPSKPKSDD